LIIADGRAVTAEEIIAALDLQPHPEGGHFLETFRDEPGNGERALSTAIYYLLRSGEASRWHRVDAAEVWHWYAGAPLELSQCPIGGAPTAQTLGNRIKSGERPQIVVSAGVWQSARSLGDWTLVGCTVAPGFEFAGFELAPDGWEPGG